MLALANIGLAAPALSGPPFITDDPEPTDTGHWEIYAPFVEGSGRGGEQEGSTGAEFNYGAAANLQLTLGIPASYRHDQAGWHVGRGDLEVSVKYRFVHDEAAGFSIAVFPGMTLPTASGGLGNSHVTGFLPVWLQKDIGPWSIFGGGGFAMNPGSGNRDYWTGGIAVTRTLSDRLLLGLEADRQGADSLDGRASTSIGLGTIMKLNGPFRLLASAGPTLTDGQSGAAFHAFIALGIDL